jgi:hypothetical protein
MSSLSFPEVVPATSDRPTENRLADNNPGGLANLFARQAALRAYFFGRITEQDMQEILDVLLRRAKQGELPYIKLLFSYVIGKPRPVAEPGLLDLVEMHMLQQTASISRPPKPPQRQRERHAAPDGDDE